MIAVSFTLAALIGVVTFAWLWMIPLPTAIAIVSIPTNPLPRPVPYLTRLTLASGKNAQTFIVAAYASRGATAIPVVAQTPNHPYRRGARIDLESMTVALQPRHPWARKA